MREIRKVVTGALEVERSEKSIGSSLEACVQLHLLHEKDLDLVAGLDMAELSICSTVEVIQRPSEKGAYSLDGVDGVFVHVEGAPGKKCDRCWQYSGEVGHMKAHPQLCKRCCSVIMQGDISGA